MDLIWKYDSLDSLGKLNVENMLFSVCCQDFTLGNCDGELKLVGYKPIKFARV